MDTSPTSRDGRQEGVDIPWGLNPKGVVPLCRTVWISYIILSDREPPQAPFFLPPSPRRGN